MYLDLLIKLKVIFKKKDYTSVYSLDYEVVDISDYTTHSLNLIGDPSKI